uniref:Uncharacterized protein n=1 Tax=Rhizophora mucronata TaxID=61149 RepID=A0A2P2M447_RHIMU
MLKRVSINLTCTCEQKPRPYPLCQTQHVQRTHHIGLDSLDRIELIMDRRCGASQVVDLINFQQNRLDDIVSNELKSRIPKQMHQVFFPSGEKVINHDNLIPARDQLIHEMAADKPGPTGNHNPGPPAPDPRRDPSRHRALGEQAGGGGVRAKTCAGGKGGGGGSGERRMDSGIGRADAVEGGLEDEEGGADQDADEDK